VSSNCDSSMSRQKTSLGSIPVGYPEMDTKSSHDHQELSNCDSSMSRQKTSLGSIPVGYPEMDTKSSHDHQEFKFAIVA